VALLLEAGGDPTRPNQSGSTPFSPRGTEHGRGGSGEVVAQQAQRQIIREFLGRGVSPTLKDGRGKTVGGLREEWMNTRGAGRHWRLKRFQNRPPELTRGCDERASVLECGWPATAFERKGNERITEQVSAHNRLRSKAAATLCSAARTPKTLARCTESA
jgi:hypothetical protein